MPCLDWANMALYSLNPDLIKPNLHKLYNVYYNSLKKSCLAFGLDPPFKFENFVQDIETKGFPLSFIFIIFFYDPIGREPNMAKRVQWMWEMILKFNQDFFD